MSIVLTLLYFIPGGRHIDDAYDAFVQVRERYQPYLSLSEMTKTDTDTDTRHRHTHTHTQDIAIDTYSHLYSLTTDPIMHCTCTDQELQVLGGGSARQRVFHRFFQLLW